MNGLLRGIAWRQAGALLTILRRHEHISIMCGRHRDRLKIKDMTRISMDKQNGSSAKRTAMVRRMDRYKLCQLRQLTLSGVLFDKIARQVDAQQTSWC
jgi:hypothetical protein